MLKRVINPDNSINPLGVFQAWTGCMSMYKQREDAVQAMMDKRTVAEFVQKVWLPGIGSQDGGIAMAWSADDIYIWVGPATGLIDYAQFALVGTSAVASLASQAWGNTLWQSYLIDVLGAIRAQLALISQPGRFVQIAGFSQGAAMATLLARALSQQVNGYVVNAVGFGQPKTIANSFLPAVNEKVVRIVNLNDPVDLVPPLDDIRTEGGPYPGLPVPTAWANYGRRYQINETLDLVQQNDLPTPPIPQLLLNLTNNIGQHTAGAYSGAVSGMYARTPAGGAIDGGSPSYILRQLISEEPIIFFGPQLVKQPQLPDQVDQKPAPVQTTYLIQELVIPVPVPVQEQFLIQEMVIPGFATPPSLTRDPG